MRLGTLTVLLFVLVCNVGCLSPLALSTMGTAGSNAPVVFNHLGGGQGESFCIAEYDHVIAATLRTAEALSLVEKEKNAEKDQTFFRYYDAKKDKIDLLIERRSATMTSIKFNVGWFGSLAFGRLMMQQIIFELKESKSFLEDWTPMMGRGADP
jgi:hypothetical protein